MVSKRYDVIQIGSGLKRKVVFLNIWLRELGLKRKEVLREKRVTHPEAESNPSGWVTLKPPAKATRPQIGSDQPQ